MLKWSGVEWSSLGLRMEMDMGYGYGEYSFTINEQIDMFE